MGKQSYSYSTGETIYAELLRVVGDAADTSVEFMQEESIVYAINEIKRQIWHAPFAGMEIDRGRGIVVQGNGKGWDFAEKDAPMSFVGPTSLGATLTKGSTGSATVASTTNMDSDGGAFVIYDAKGTWDYVTYSSVTNATTVASVGDVGIAHSSGEIIEHLYKLPANFERAKHLKVYGDEIYEGSEDPEPDFFCTKDGFLWMPRNFGTTTGTLVYWKKPTDITDISETLDIPVELNPVLLGILKGRAFDLGGESEEMVRRAYDGAAGALSTALGFTTQTSNKRIRLGRRPPQSPTQWRGQYRPSRFDQGSGYV